MNRYDLDQVHYIIKELAEHCISAEEALSEAALEEKILEYIQEVFSEVFLSIEDMQTLVTYIFNAINGYGILQPLIDDSDINEIMINSSEDIFIEKKGEIKKLEYGFESEEKLMNIIQMIVSSVNRTVNISTPIVDARLEDGSRVNIVLPPISLKGPIVTIRKFPETPLTIEDLIRKKTLSRKVAKVLEKLVIAKYNIFISGGTSSGKTTFLNVLSNFIPKNERVITIEDSAELQINKIENLVSLETRNSNTEGKGEILMEELIKTSLRMRPDRIIVGEVRGREALQMLQAMNTGHDGSLSTGHSNSVKDMLTRIETMVLSGVEMPSNAIKKQIVGGIDIVIHLAKLRDQTRRVMDISEVSHYEEGKIHIHPLFKFKEEEGENPNIINGGLICVTKKLKNTTKLELAGIQLELGNYYENK